MRADRFQVFRDCGAVLCLFIQADIFLHLFEWPQYKPINEQKADHAEKNLEERIRLLYVAMTRARDRLILTGTRKESKGKKSTAKHWLNWLDQGLPEEYSGLKRAENPADAPAAGGQLPAPVRPENIPDRELSGLLENTAPLDSFGGRTMTEFSATSLREYDLCPRRYYYGVIENIPPLEEAVLEEMPPEETAPEKATEEKLAAERQGSGEEPSLNRQPSAAALPADVLGSLVHNVLEKYAKWRMHNQFREDDRVWHDLYENAVRETAGGRFDLAAEAEAMLQAYLHSDLYRSFALRQRFAEFGFRLPLLEDDRYTYTVTGIIDAVAEQEDGNLEIIDYKSGKPPQKAGPDETISRGYAWQLALYKMALDHLLRVREKASPENSGESSPGVTKASLHFLRDRSEWALPGKDYRQEILQVCREIAEKKKEEEFTIKTENCFLCPFAYMCKK